MKGGQESGKKWLHNLNYVFFQLNFLILCDISAEFHLNCKFIVIKIINCASLLSNTCNLFSRIFEVFNEMEIEINAINNKNLRKFYLKTSVRGNEMSYIIF